MSVHDTLHSSPEQDKKIYRGIYRLLFTVVLIFTLILAVNQLQYSELSKKVELENEYHLGISQVGSAIVSEVESIKLWLRDYLITKRRMKDKSLYASSQFLMQDRINTFIYVINTHIDKAGLIQWRYADPDYEHVIYVLQQESEEAVIRLNYLLVTADYSNQDIDTAFFSLTAASHQLQRLHETAHDDLRDELEIKRQQYRILVTGLSLVFIVLGMAVVLKLLRQVRLALSEQAAAQVKLQNSRHYNRMLFETSPVGLMLRTMDGVLVDFNSAYVSIIGRSVDETKRLGYWDITPKEYAEDEQREVESLKATGHYGPYEKEYIHKDGHRVPVRLLGHIMERDGEQLIWSSVEDITIQKEADLALQQSRGKLEEKVQERTHAYKEAKDEADRANRAKSEFLSRMSHELRTPMNAILGFGQLLEMEVSDELSKLNVQEILRAGDHLLKLINEILDLSKIETGALSLSLENVHLSMIVEECFALIKPLAEEKGVHVVNELSCVGDHVISVDYTRFKQVLLNLLSNAIKYNRNEGTVTVNCEVVSRQRLRISVSDSGIGLSEEQQEQLFKPFERVGAEDTAIEGTGIGLVITKHLVEQMGGDIGVNSQPGQGSTFWVEIALAECNSQVCSQLYPQKILEQQGAKALSPAKTILYIEDNPANLRLVEQVVSRQTPYIFISAHDALLGLHMAEAQKPDLILLDINLPGMDGYKALSKLQAQEETRNIPVIAISANAMTRDVQRGVGAGFKDYLTKPINIEKLLAVINDFMVEEK